MALNSSLRWTCPACHADNEEPEPLDLEVNLPLAHNGLMRPGSARVVYAKRVFAATCEACGFVSFYDTNFIRAQSR